MSRPRASNDHATPLKCEDPSYCLTLVLGLPQRMLCDHSGVHIFLCGSDPARDRHLRARLLEGAEMLEPSEIEIFGDQESSSTSTVDVSWLDHLRTADLVVFDCTYPSQWLMFELGAVQATDIPTLLIAESSALLGPEFSPFRVLIYGETDRQLRMFAASTWVEALRMIKGDPSAVPAQWSASSEGKSAFISYCHVDDHYLRRLLVHLAPLEREGLIEAWADTRLVAGDQWRTEIRDALGRARVAILLISADFLASEFIVTNELPPLLEKAETRGTRIIPVILSPCRFTRTPELARFQAINDPRNFLAGLPVHGQDEVFDKVAELVEKVIRTS